MGLRPLEVSSRTPSVAHVVDNHGETLEEREPPQRVENEPGQNTNSFS